MVLLARALSRSCRGANESLLVGYVAIQLIIILIIIILILILIIIIIIIMMMMMTLLDNTIIGRTSSSHCGPLKLQIRIAKIRSKNTVKIKN